MESALSLAKSLENIVIFFESTCFTDFTSSQYCKAPGGVASQSFFDLERLKELEQMV